MRPLLTLLLIACMYSMIDAWASNRRVDDVLNEVRSNYNRIRRLASYMSYNRQYISNNGRSINYNRGYINSNKAGIYINFESIVNVTEELQNAEDDIASTNADLKSTRENMTSTTDKLTSTQLDILEKLRHMDDRLNRTESKQKEIGFQVRQAGKDLKLGAQDVLKFDTVLKNDGGAYNPTSGIFIAPVSGTYLFWASVTGEHPGFDLRVDLIKEGKVLAKGFSTRLTKWGSASLAFLTSVRKGEHIWFMSSSDAGKQASIFSTSSYYGGAIIYV